MDEQKQTVRTRNYVRTCLKVGLFLLLLIVGLWQSSALWAPSALRLLLSSAGIDSRSITYLSGGRIAIVGLSYRSDELQVQAENMEIPQPTRLILAYLRGQAPPSALIANWTIVTTGSAEPMVQENSTPPQLPQLVQEHLQLFLRLKPILPTLQFSAGVVSVNGQASQLSIPLLLQHGHFLYIQSNLAEPEIEADLYLSVENEHSLTGFCNYRA